MDKKKPHAPQGEEHKGHTAVQEVPAAAEPIAAGSEPLRIKELEEALAAKEAEARENWDKFVRERADLENYKKRVQREKEELLKYGNETLLLEVLPVLDNMERALLHASEESLDAVIEGIKLTHSMLLAALKKYGVTTIETAKGGVFDPALHQAMCQVESGECAANTVVEEFQKGYLLNERLLRPAMVSVACTPKSGDQ